MIIASLTIKSKKIIIPLICCILLLKVNMYKFAAELSIIIHFFFIVFVILGSILCFFKTKLIFLHLLSVSWGVYIELSSNVCPLTYLENWFLQKAGLVSYTEGFISKYIFKIVYPSGLTEQIQIYLALGLIFINVTMYLLLYLFKKKLINNR